MRIRSSSFLFTAAVAAALGWLALRPVSVTESDSGMKSTPAKEAATAVSAGSVPPRAGLTAGGVPPHIVAPAKAATPSAPATVFGEYVQAKQYRALYERLKSSAEGETAEGRLVLWEILRNCATITEGRRYNYRPPVPKRDDFIAGLGPADPQRDQRIAAFDEFSANRCAGFEGIAITQAELDRVLQASASAGDPRARALQVEQDLWMQRRQQGRDGVALTDATIDSLKQVLASKDPEAIRVAGRVMANTWADTSLRIGADQQPVEARAFMNAWLVLSCEYGAPCGTDTPRMQQACALQGHCGAQSYPDYVYYYAASPYDSQLTQQYRAILQNAIETGDWSQLTVVRGLPMPVGRAAFLPGPR